MIRDNQKSFNRIHVVVDGILIAVTYLLSYFLRFDLLTFIPIFVIEDGVGYYSLSVYASYLIYIIPGFLIIYNECGLYRPRRGKDQSHEFWNVIKANAFGLLYFTFILSFIAREVNISRGFELLFVVMNTFTAYLFRSVLERVLRAIRRRGRNLKHVLIVGYSRAAEGYIDRIKSNAQWGYYVYGILDNTMAKGTLYKKVPVVGTIDELESFIDNNNFDEIAITISITEYATLADIVAICEKSGIHTKFIPDYHNIIPTVPYMEDLAGLPVINIRNVPLTNFWNRLVKRIFDFLGSAVLIVLFSPLMLVISIIIKLTSPGPLIFSQVRVGLNNKEFRMYKFRSMVTQRAENEEKRWTTAGDSRVTRIGRFIRKTSIDELPQLFNVFIGNMSLVGPRPERPFFVEKFKEEIPRYMIKHQVRPGMTGLAQIKGFRGDTSIQKRIEYDLYYIENWTFGMDFRILFMTLFKGFVNHNAY